MRSVLQGALTGLPRALERLAAWHAGFAKGDELPRRRPLRRGSPPFHTPGTATFVTPLFILYCIKYANWLE